jgi:hypothetical protein
MFYGSSFLLVEAVGAKDLFFMEGGLLEITLVI